MVNEFMFCPNCGKGEQTSNSYCRNCGEFLPDLTKKKLGMQPFGGETPEEQIRTNLILNLLSALVSLTLAISLYATFLGKDAGQLIYLTAAFLLAMSAWQFSTCIIGLKLRKNFNKRREGVVSTESNAETQTQFKTAKTKELLNEADFRDVAPPSVTENTTKILSKKIKNQSS
jgi:hypothetical protein